MKSIERKPRRIAVAVLSVIVIAIMWINKDVLGLWSGISSEDILPLLMTNGLVMLAKIAVLAGGIYLIKTVFAKIKNR
ncbi:MAG: hypothetical protein IJO01_02800 [Oscillospiraceae bacterium]|nr:hypothetical protein [Oscillospiraceae bacterium]